MTQNKESDKQYSHVDKSPGLSWLQNTRPKPKPKNKVDNS